MAENYSYTTPAPELKDYEAAKLPTYQAQDEQVNQTYDAAKDSAIAALKGAYDTSILDAEANLAKIPGIYQQKENAVAAEAEKQRQAFNEYAATRGINSGVGGQAQLAMGAQLQGNLTSLRQSQANAIADAQLQITKIKTKYQDDVAAAVAENDYQRAAALLAEYQTAARSVVDVAQRQADEDYRAYQSQLGNTQYTAEWNRAEQQRQSDLARDMIDKTLAAGYSAEYIRDNMPEAFAASGYDFDYLAAMYMYYYGQKYSSGGGGSRGGGGGGRSSTEEYAPNTETTTDRKALAKVRDVNIYDTSAFRQANKDRAYQNTK